MAYRIKGVIMRKIDLDIVIEETRNEIRYIGELDINDKYSEVSVGQILSEIRRHASSLVEGKGRQYNKKNVVPGTIRGNSKGIRVIRDIDNKLRRIHIYDRYIRPALKTRFKNYYNMRIIDLKDLIGLQDEDFVDVVYKSILLRAADPDGKKNALHFIQHNNDNKVVLVDSIVNSQEGKSKNVKVKGLKSKIVKIRIKRFLYNIPVLGYFVKFVIDFCLLPKRLRDFQRSFDDVYQHIKEMNVKLKDAEYQTIIDSIQQNIIEINNKISEIENFRNNLMKERDEELRELFLQKEVLDKMYLNYKEKVMLDSREKVKNRLETYLDKIDKYFYGIDRKELRIIDLGCGECEWVELLNKHGYNAIGVDSNSEIVRKISNIYPNLNIIEKDALDYLRDAEDNSIDVISAIHVIEHMEVVDIIKFLSECKRVLKKGGLLIVETPNPLNILTATYYFYLDPTHKKPIPSELLAFLVNESGLSVKERIMLHPLNFVPYEYKNEDPIKDIVFRFNKEQAYSILAVKE